MQKNELFVARVVLAAATGMVVMSPVRAAPCPRYEAEPVFASCPPVTGPVYTATVDANGLFVGGKVCGLSPSRPVYVNANGEVSELPLLEGAGALGNMSVSRSLNGNIFIGPVSSSSLGGTFSWIGDGSSVGLLDVPDDYTQALATGISPDLVVVGYGRGASTKGQARACGWDADGFHFVLPGVDGLYWSKPGHVEVDGTVSGIVAVSFEDRRARPVIFGDDGPEFLELSVGMNTGRIYDTNGRGTLVGFAGTAAASGFQTVPFPAKWLDGKIELLPNPFATSFPYGRAWGVNARGDIVGELKSTTSPSSDNKYVLWKDGSVYDIRTLVEGGDDFPVFYIYDVEGISDSGQIALDAHLGSYATTVLLTPVPPIPGDSTCDGRVDFFDVAHVLNSWGPGSSSTADLDGSESVDINDLVLVLSSWG